MFFIDSWVWIEFFSEGDRSEKAEKVIEKLEDQEGVISTTVLMEVKYRIKKKFDEELAERVIRVIESFDNLTILPVTAKVAKNAADLRDKYYRRKTRELSYADAIHLSTAILTDCDVLYSGDPDFEGVDELETVTIE